MNYSTETYRLSIRHFFKFRNSPYIYNKLLEYEIYSSLALKETAQQNSQHCTKLQNEVQNVFHNKIS